MFSITTSSVTLEYTSTKRYCTNERLVPIGSIIASPSSRSKGMSRFVDKSMVEYCKNELKCRRDFLFQDFK